MAPGLSELESLHSMCQPTCVSPRCGRGDCSVRVSTGAAICIDCDRCRCIRDGARRPDFIVLYDQSNSSLSRWVVVEMKSRASHPVQIVEQLQAGADLIQDKACFQLQTPPVHLVPLLLHTRGIHTSDLQIINNRRISFRGKLYPIQTRRCGVELSQVLG